MLGRQISDFLVPQHAILHGADFRVPNAWAIAAHADNGGTLLHLDDWIGKRLVNADKRFEFQISGRGSKPRTDEVRDITLRLLHWRYYFAKHHGCGHSSF
jgi:hypothetical protein